MKLRASVRQSCAVIVFVGVILASSAKFATAQSQICNQGVCVKTWQQDTGTTTPPGFSYRTGENLRESIITPASFHQQDFDFGQLCSAQLDGQIYGQPLVATNVTIPSLNYTGPVAYVVTQNDSVYAIQATPPASGNACNILLGPVSLLNGNLANQPTMSAVGCANVGGGPDSCKNTMGPTVGVLSTPVLNIDPSGTTGTLYLVAEMQSGTKPNIVFYHFLHALEITTLAEGMGNEKFGAPVQICGTGCGAYTSSSKFSHDHIQRPGLLYVPASLGNGLASDYVYMAFSFMDGGGFPFPNGAIFGYNATALNNTPFFFSTSDGLEQRSNGAGVWMGGAGLAFGPDGSGTNWIYLTTANGTYDSTSSWGDSFIKLNPNGLTMPVTNGYFTPFDEDYRSDPTCGAPQPGDMDFGSGGVMLIPDHTLSNATLGYLAVNGDKEGAVWFIRRDVPGGFAGQLTGCQTDGVNNNVQTFTINRWQTIHNGVAFWKPGSPAVAAGPAFLYMSGESSHFLDQLKLCTTPGDLLPACNQTILKGSLFGGGAASQGITPTISAASPQADDALVWALEKTDGSIAQGANAPAVLFAFDAVSMNTLYSSANCEADIILPPATKFSVPVVANGYVYFGTQDVNGEPPNETNTGLGRFYIFGPGRTGDCDKVKRRH